MLPKLLAEIVSAEAAKLWKGSVRLAVIFSLLGLVVMAVVTGVIFVLVGLYLSLAESFPPWQAGMIVGGGIILCATILLIVLAQQGKDVSIKSGSSSALVSDESATQLGSTLGVIAAKSNIKTSDVILTVLISGIVLGASPSLRRQILTTLSAIAKSNNKID